MKRYKQDQRPTVVAIAKSVSDEEAEVSSGRRKPRILIAGEFSAGKTRLITGLLHDDVLPSNVTATALPPVWIVGGAPAMAAVTLSNTVKAIKSYDEVSLKDTRFIIVSHPAEILKAIDIIDTPGSSDPNISTESWEEMLSYADSVIWCTNATQAWRQSEKAFWKELPDQLVGDATLLVTHADRMPDTQMADRVLRRVQREARPFFSTFKMAALIDPRDVAGVSEMVIRDIAPRAGQLGQSNAMVASFAAKQEKAADDQGLRGQSQPAIIPRRVKPFDKSCSLQFPDKRDTVGQIEDDPTPAKDDEFNAESGADEALNDVAHSKDDKKMRPEAEFSLPAEDAPPLFDDVESEDTQQRTVPSLSAKELWRRVLKDIDRSDPEAILGGVDILISYVEQQAHAGPKHVLQENTDNSEQGELLTIREFMEAEA
ncbi:hypothetical protein E2K80_07885 [Rhodophyticola sp. CCM32]|uniref:dynamin family protein n=1 Tax=Rhodophyticola sp. CCM32 TaxID=2916397 RepID=UPI00107F248C|nr:dynamin family protein [Rhodophyticola sp. CCM32]QBY00666.1 hypothetical protein E2K80_07885 [Rhodophyticola sp. CCM32]